MTEQIHYAAICHRNGRTEISPPMQSFDEAYEYYIIWMHDFCDEALRATKWRGVFDRDDLMLAMGLQVMDDAD